MDLNSTYKLNNNVNIPVLGLGVYRSSAGAETMNAVRYALQAGYRHIDTAKIYGNERDVGQAIADNDIPREQVFLTTKLWNADQGYNSTERALQQSLDELQMNYMDLYLMHWPVEHKRLQSWKAMEEALKAGKTRAIGVSNFMRRHLEELIDHSTILPAVNQIELSPYNYKQRKDTIDFCLFHGIRIEAYSPLTKGRKLNDPDLKRIAEKYNKSTAQILIRWVLQHNFIVIPKSTNNLRIIENASVFDFVIKNDDMVYLDSLNENLSTGWDPTDAP